MTQAHHCNQPNLLTRPTTVTNLICWRVEWPRPTTVTNLICWRVKVCRMQDCSNFRGSRCQRHSLYAVHLPGLTTRYTIMVSAWTAPIKLDQATKLSLPMSYHFYLFYGWGYARYVEWGKTHYIFVLSFIWLSILYKWCDTMFFRLDPV